MISCFVRNSNMSRFFAAFACSFSLFVVNADLSAQEGLPRKAASPATNSKDFKEKSSYGMGLDIGSSLRGNEVDVDLEALMAGIKDALSGAKSRVPTEELQKIMTDLQTQINARAEARFKAMAAKNKKEGQDFLATNRSKPGVKVLESGVQYKVLKAGRGAKPKATDLIKAHYHGTLIDGTVFDSSVDRKPAQPLEFTMTDVIPGWAEALNEMRVGDKWQIFIPSDLAYAAEPPPGSVIGPNAVLVFEIELLEAGPAPRNPPATSRK
jgi:FKBP-type peptidyl-prolyl cis-trans isomerase